MKILVTGGTGFCGSHIAKNLYDLGHDVCVTGTQTEHDLNLRILNHHLTGINWSLLKNIDVVFHQAANNDTLFEDKEEMFLANVHAPIELFKRLYKNGCKKFIYASSTAVYGNSTCPYKEEVGINPLNVYAESKAEFDKFAMDFSKNKNISVIGLRYCNVYGPGECHKKRRSSKIGQMIRNVFNQEPIPLFKSGEQKRDWIYIKDVVKANMAGMDYNGSGIFNCATGVATSFNQLVEIIKEKAPMPPSVVKIEYIDNPHESTYQNHTQCDISKLKSELYKPQYDIEKGIEEYMNYATYELKLGNK